MIPNMPLIIDSLGIAVAEIFARILGPIRLATPLGLGKPYYPLNAIAEMRGCQ